MKNFNRNFGAVLVALATMLAGCGGRQLAVPTVRIGYLPIYTDLPLFVAQQRGYFANHGVKTELVRFSSSPEIGTGLLTGNIQFGASIALAVSLSTESRDPGKLKIFVVDGENKDNYISSFVTMPNSGIRTLADLKGKKLGSFPGPNAVPFCKLLLKQAGLNPQTDLTLVELDPSIHISALASGTVDALFTYEPTATQAVLEKGAVKFMPGAVERNILNPWYGGVWVVSADFASKQPTATAATIGAIYDAIHYVRQDPKEAKRALDSYTSIKSNVALATPDIPFAMLDELDIDAFQRNADFYFEQGLVSKKIDVRTLLAPRSWVTK